MPFDAQFLTRRVGPLPVWVYALSAGALLTLVALYARGAKAGSPSSSGPTTSDTSANQGVLNYPPTVVVTPAGMTSTSTPTTTNPNGSTSPTSTPQLAWHFGGPQSDNWVWRLTTIGEQQFAQIYGGQWPGGVHAKSEQVPAGLSSYSWQLAELPAGQTWQNFAGGSGGGDGGDGGLGGTLMTRPVRAIGQWGHFVPFQPQQFVNTGSGADDGMGGRTGGGMAAIARKTGIPLTRLRSLNYHLRSPDGSYRRGIVRVA